MSLCAGVAPGLWPGLAVADLCAFCAQRWEAAKSKYPSKLQLKHRNVKASLKLAPFGTAAHAGQEISLKQDIGSMLYYI